MGILRTDRVSGLGGANAIKGSVNFGSSDLQSYNKNLAITNTSDLDIGAGNYTIEYWFNCVDTTHDGFNTSVALSEYTNGSSNNAFNLYHYKNGFRIYNRTGGSFPLLFQNDDSWISGKWHHFAWVREGTGSNENKIYLDGSLLGSAFTNDVNYSSGQHWLIGANFYTGSEGYGVNPEYGFSGHLSNVRVSNVARYSGAFTPPTSEYVVDSNTIILACQSPSNILQEETGKEVTYYVGNAFASSEGSGNYFLNSPPQASRFTPNSPVGFSTTSDVGTQFGTTFDGVTTFDSQAYMVPPGGNTRERNRGRGIFACGYIAPARDNTIDFINIQSMGNATMFGDLTEAKSQSAPAASSTRGTFSGGIIGSSNVIEFITIATTANAIDFGDLSSGNRQAPGGVSNQTRAVINGGDTPAATNVIEFFTIATAGNSADFGDAANVVNGKTGAASPTRGIFAGGYAPDRSQIEFITIASAGNATDFGECVEDRGMPAGGSNATRAIFAGGESPAGHRASIDTLLIATTGNATDFGDLQRTITEANGGASNEIRICFAGGNSPGQSPQNVIDVVNIVTTGAGADFGDLTLARRGTTGLSDSHGGL